MSIAYQYGLVTVSDDGYVTTPAGVSALADTTVEFEGTTPIVHSKGSWSVGMIIVACIVAIFTCGLGLILLFLSRSERTATIVMDTVRISDGNYTYLAQAPGGASFVSWANTWRQTLVAHQAWVASAANWSLEPRAVTDIEMTEVAITVGEADPDIEWIGAISSQQSEPQPVLAELPEKTEPLGQPQLKMFCTNCGSSIDHGMRFCSDCGTAAVG